MTAEWRARLDNAGIGAAVVNAIAPAADVHGIFECAKGGSGEIGFGAAPDAYAAFYASRNGLTVALEPEDASAFARQHDFSLLAKSPRTHYVRVPHSALEDPMLHDSLTKALDLAVVRSWQGPRWERGPDSAARAALVPKCPVHHYELAKNGWCMGCDDVAPAL
jgi:hypothetical protein